MQIVDSLEPGTGVLLWASLPCAAGPPWKRLNQKIDSARKKIAADFATFERLVANFVVLARHVVYTRAGDIAFEWPETLPSSGRKNATCGSGTKSRISSTSSR